jgi:hypothetical protein
MHCDRGARRHLPPMDDEKNQNELPASGLDRTAFART